MVNVLIHYGEIGLKGKNIGVFERQLVKNIKASLTQSKIEIKKIGTDQKRIIAKVDGEETEIIKALQKVFGIKYFSFFTECNPDIEEIKLTVGKMMSGTEVAFKTRRVDKGFPLKSPDVNAELGGIAHDKGIKVNYGCDNIISTEIMKTKALVYGQRYGGLGGLPVGTSGRVLCLLSGGIDSPVAAWNLMRRGCRVDFLHFHAVNDVEKSKMVEIKKLLDEFQEESKIYFVPYSIYEETTMGKFDRHDLIVFKHYILKVAERLCETKWYDAIVTGDNLAQVASQTIENLRATSLGVKRMIFRPLLTYEKEEIISLSKKIGVYDLSIEKYKDCCSILSKNPTTKTKVEKFEKSLEEIDMDKLVEDSLREIN